MELKGRTSCRSATRSPLGLAAVAASLAALICVALQIWRPWFFLTNDNLTQWMPPMVEMARHFSAGEPFFVSNYLFGGAYDWRTDASVFPLISPILPLLSPLATSKWYFGMVDVIATFELIVVATTFAGCAAWLRAHHMLPLSDRIVVVASMSYTFSPFILLLGASWMGFVNAQAAWPAVFVALQIQRIGRSVGILFGAFAFSLFGGNLHPFFFLVLGSVVMAAGIAIHQRSPKPVLYLAISLAAVGLVAGFVLGHGGLQIFATGQVRAFGAVKSSVLNIHPPALLASFLLGPISRFVGGPPPLFGSGPDWGAALAYSTINLPAVVALIRGGWRQKSSQILLAATTAVGLLIWRPSWLAAVFSTLPVFQATRWPLREIVILIFLAHLLFLFNYRPLRRPWEVALWVVAVVPIAVLIWAGPPSIAKTELSRRLIVSGTADEYWAQIRPTLNSAPNIPTFAFAGVDDVAEVAPFPLIPSHNFPALFGVLSVSGYSTGTPLARDLQRLLPPDTRGAYSASQARYYHQKFPNSRLTVLITSDPPQWVVIESGQERQFRLDPETLELHASPPKILQGDSPESHR